jgi:hypothetical protein
MSNPAGLPLLVMATRKRAAVDLTGIRQRGGTFQVRVFIGNDAVTGKKVMATGSARHAERRDRAS